MLHLKTIKYKLYKILYVGFIYPILDSEWVLPLIIVPKEGVTRQFVWTIGNLTKPLERK
jgi:hypothetical protein